MTQLPSDLMTKKHLGFGYSDFDPCLVPATPGQEDASSLKITGEI